MVLNVAPGLNVVDVGAPELVVQGFDELILDRLGHVLHLFTFARLTKSVEGRLREGAPRALGAQRPPVASGLPADAVAVGVHRDGDLVDAEGRGLLPALALAPGGAGSDLLLRLGLRLALGIRVDPAARRRCPCRRPSRRPSPACARPR